jgi:nicotinate-nucleotide pyrophosphorylase (carboxylating)
MTGMGTIRIAPAALDWTIAMSPSRYGFGEREERNAEALVAQALTEDLGDDGDITSIATIPDDARGAGRIVARSTGVLAGLPVIERLVRDFGLASGWQPRLADGDRLEPGTEIARIAGSVRALLAMERTALNFLQRLSGIASLTARFVERVAHTRAEVYDTRKTTPGWRALEKYAVRCGGGCNHRFGLYDAVLFKDNHLAWLEGPGRGSTGPRHVFAAAIARARASTARGTVVEIEVDTLEQLDCALGCGPDIVLLDNFGADQMAEAVRRRDALAPRVQLEASGGVTLATVAALAETGVDRVSAGALTHSAPALDLALDVDFEPADRLTGAEAGRADRRIDRADSDGQPS